MLNIQTGMKNMYFWQRKAATEASATDENDQQKPLLLELRSA